MLDIAFAYNRFKFLGNEFLTWLWFVIENDPGYLKNISPDLSSLETGNRIVLENRQHQTVERVTIKGDDANLEEGILALQKGALVAEINLSFKAGDQEWRFSIKGESLNISGFKPPFTGPVETAKDVEGAVLEKVYLYEQAIQLVDNLYKNFIKIRASSQWPSKVVPMIKKWIHA
jgi:hypothetical protein